MSAEKKVALLPHKLPMWYETPALQKCLNIKCKKEKEQLTKNKYVIEKKKIFTNYLNSRNNINARFNNAKEKRDVEYGKAYMKYMKERTKIKMKIMKEKEHNDLLDCKLKSCYNDILNTLKVRIESILAHTKKNTEEYKLASKYNKILTQIGKKTKLTREDINRFDIDMVKTILKEHTGKQYW